MGESVDKFPCEAQIGPANVLICFIFLGSLDKWIFHPKMYEAQIGPASKAHQNTYTEEFSND